jgi:hypothetical protein
MGEIAFQEQMYGTGCSMNVHEFQMRTGETIPQIHE